MRAERAQRGQSPLPPLLVRDPRLPPRSPSLRKGPQAERQAHADSHHQRRRNQRARAQGSRERSPARIAGPGGEVWTVAPAFEQSGVGHCISYTHPTMLAKMAERRYAAEGSPADCVLAGIHEVMKDARPDLVLSGVNRGNNAAENVLYSGTVGGAMEAALQNLPAIALSQFYGPENVELDNPFEAAATPTANAGRSATSSTKAIWDTGGYRVFYNVNFPRSRPPVSRASRSPPRASARTPPFGVEPQISPSGRLFFWIKGGPQHNRSRPRHRCRREPRRLHLGHAAPRRPHRARRDGRPARPGSMSDAHRRPSRPNARWPSSMRCARVA
jgi:5'-nucleotidase